MKPKVYYALKRTSDGHVLEARQGAKFKKVPTGYKQVKLTKEVLSGGSLDSANKYTPKPEDTAAATKAKALEDNLMALDPTSTGLTVAKVNDKINTVIKYLQR